ncbi:MAG: TIR domain-containing protein, partial [Tsuneonella sp.]
MRMGQEGGGHAPDIFLSYSRVDEVHAVRLMEFLQASGFSVWWDGMLEAGTVFTSKTEQALNDAKAVVVLWSPRSVDSNWVRDEAQAARDDGRLVPVSIEGAQPPLGFRQFQSVDLSAWTGDPGAPEARNVRDSVARLVGRGVEPALAITTAGYRSPATPASNTAGRRSWAFAAIAALLLVAGALFAFNQFGGDRAEAAANSIAIMPFDNLSGQREQDYFSSGLSEEMRQVLRQSASLRVAAKTSTDEVAAEGVGAQEIAKKLDVRYLLDGSVRRSGETVRVAVTLIDGDTGFDVWSETYDRSLNDIFAVQSDIAAKVAGALQIKVAAGAGGDLDRRGGTDNPAAYDAFLRGKALYDLARDETTDRAAQREFESAIAADPEYGAAWAALSRVQTLIANSYPSDKPLGQAYDDAVKSAQRAVSVAPDLAASQLALGFVMFNGRLDVAAAEQPFAEANRLGQGDADILQAYASYAARVGKFDEAKAAIGRALRLDPINAVARRSEAVILFAAGDLEGSRRAIEKALKLNPDIRVAHRILGDIAYSKGDFRAALTEYRKEQSPLSRL